MEPTGLSLPETCTYAIRLRREDGTEVVVRRLCPYIATCQELGKDCSGKPPLGDIAPGPTAASPQSEGLSEIDK